VDAAVRALLRCLPTFDAPGDQRQQGRRVSQRPAAETARSSGDGHRLVLNEQGGSLRAR